MPTFRIFRINDFSEKTLKGFAIVVIFAGVTLKAYDAFDALASATTDTNIAYLFPNSGGITPSETDIDE